MAQDFLALLWSTFLMPERGWRERLASVFTKEALRKDKQSLRKVAKAADVSHTQITNIIEKGQSPSIETLEAICRARGVPLAWVLFGWPATKETEELLRALADLEPEIRDRLLGLIPSLRNRGHL